MIRSPHSGHTHSMVCFLQFSSILRNVLASMNDMTNAGIWNTTKHIENTAERTTPNMEQQIAKMNLRRPPGCLRPLSMSFQG